MRDRLADLSSGASTSTSASSSATSSTASLSSDPDNQQQTSSSDNDNSQISDAELLKIFEEISKSQTCSNVSKLKLAVVHHDGVFVLIVPDMDLFTVPLTFSEWFKILRNRSFAKC